MVTYSYNKTNEMHQFLKFIFGIELCMFWTGFLSIIRSLVLYTLGSIFYQCIYGFF
jgi:hypothetical protein